MELLAALLQVPRPRRIASLADLRAHLTVHASEPDTITRAVIAGLAATSIGYAFAGGYQAALARLFPQLSKQASSVFACLCATEEGGGHPRAMRTRLDGAALTGKKTFVTLGSEADVMLVVATRGDGEDGKPRLVVVRVPKERAGVTLRDRPPTPVAPEIPHAEVTFDRVAIAEDEILPGDGYTAYLKPFRTAEDAHVMAAILGHLVGLARDHAWSREWIEDAASAELSLQAIGAGDPSSPAVHVALAGALKQVRSLVATADVAKLDPDERARLERDRNLLRIAETVRAKRLESAWGSLALGV